MVQAPGGYAPDRQFRQCRNRDIGEAWVVSLQYYPRGRDPQPLDRQFTVEDGDDDGTVFGFQCPVDHELVTVADAGLLHGLPSNSDDKGAGDILDQVFVEVDPAVEVVLGGRGIAGGHGYRSQQNGHQRESRIYHTGANYRAHNTPFFEYMFDTLL